MMISSKKHLCYLAKVNEEVIDLFLENKTEAIKSWTKTKRNPDGTAKIDSNGKPKTRVINSVVDIRLYKIYKAITADLAAISLPDCCHGGVNGRSNITNAIAHFGSKHYFVIDIKGFYPSFDYERVYKTLRRLGYSKGVSRIISTLTTKRNHAGQKHAELIQGISPSSYIANHGFIPVDNLIISFLENPEIKYTRFIDDITISSIKPFSDKHQIIINIIRSFGFEIARDKVMAGNGAIITGIKVSEKQFKPPIERELLLQKRRDKGDSPLVINAIERYFRKIRRSKPTPPTTGERGLRGIL